MIKITYFVHGTTTDNEHNKATGWLPGELSELGKTQAAELERLVADKKFDIVFCSDLKRAIDSAQLAFSSQYAIIQDDRLRECNYGDFDGQDHTFKDNIKTYINMPFPNGESYRDTEKRMRLFINYLKEKYQDAHIAIMAHQAPQLALEVLTNNKTWEQAIDEDWRKTKSWQPGWEYTVS